MKMQEDIIQKFVDMKDDQDYLSKYDDDLTYLLVACKIVLSDT